MSMPGLGPAPTSFLFDDKKDAKSVFLDSHTRLLVLWIRPTDATAVEVGRHATSLARGLAVCELYFLIARNAANTETVSLKHCFSPNLTFKGAANRSDAARMPPAPWQGR